VARPKGLRIQAWRVPPGLQHVPTRRESDSSTGTSWVCQDRCTTSSTSDFAIDQGFVRSRNAIFLFGLALTVFLPPLLPARTLHIGTYLVPLFLYMTGECVLVQLLKIAGRSNLSIICESNLLRLWEESSATSDVRRQYDGTNSSSQILLSAQSAINVSNTETNGVSTDLSTRSHRDRVCGSCVYVDARPTCLSACSGERLVAGGPCRDIDPILQPTFSSVQFVQLQLAAVTLSCRRCHAFSLCRYAIEGALDGDHRTQVGRQIDQ